MHSFDRADLLSRLDGDEELFREIVDLFLSEGPGQMEIIEAALHGGNASMIERSAHSLKGAAGNISAARLRKIAEAIEIAARQGKLASAVSLGEALEREYQALLAEITKTLTCREVGDE